MKYGNFNLLKFNNILKLNDTVHRKRKGVYVYDEYLTLDTETSHTPLMYDKKGKYIEGSAKGWIYQWAITSNDNIYNGRKPSELVEFYKNLLSNNIISSSCQLITFVHNLSYDLEYFIRYFIKEFGIPKVIASGNREIIQAEFNNGLVFRCSYKLSNKSLNQWSSDYDTEHKKLVGFVDYKKLHFQDSKLEFKDYLYMWNDVLSMRECIDVALKINNDTPASIPLTSTGYIRRNIKRRFYRYNKDNYAKGIREFSNTRLDATVYNMLLSEMAGGITHGNRFYANKIIGTSNTYPYIDHFDFESMYPSEMVVNEFPIGKPILEYDRDIDSFQYSYKELLKLIECNRSFIAQVDIIDMELKDKSTTMPYAQEFKFKEGCTKGTKFICDNGRILKMNGISTVFINNIDFKWLMKQYNFSIRCVKVYSFRNGKLPEFILDEVNELYAEKTNLKMYIEKVKHTASREEMLELKIRLLQVKALLNACYGMTASKIARLEYLIDQNGNWYTGDFNVQKSLDEYYSNKGNCMRYVFGTFVTSYARDRLLSTCEYIEAHGGRVLYCDTDSAFFLSNDKVRNAICELNSLWIKEAEEKQAYVYLSNGEKHYYLHFSDEEDDIKLFKFLHAKCYGFVDNNNKLSITVAGVPKRVIQPDGTFFYREDEIKRLKNLKKQFTFKKCGGSGCKYEVHEPTEEDIEGHITEYSNSAIIFETTKTLSELDVYDI